MSETKQENAEPTPGPSDVPDTIRMGEHIAEVGVWINQPPGERDGLVDGKVTLTFLMRGNANPYGYAQDVCETAEAETDLRVELAKMLAYLKQRAKRLWVVGNTDTEEYGTVLALIEEATGEPFDPETAMDGDA